MPDMDALIRAVQGDSSGLTGLAPAAVSTPQPNADAAAPQMDIMSIFRQLLSTPEIQQPRQAMEGQRGRLAELEQQQADLPIPATGPHNLALRILAGTRPGAAISDAVYGPGVQRYEAQKRQIADQIATLRGQTDISKDELTAGTGLAGTAGTAGYRTGELQLGAQRNQVAADKAKSYAQSVQNKLQMGMRGLDLSALRTGSQLELNKARIMLDNVLAQTLPERNDITLHGIDAGNETRQAVADLEAQMGLEKEHPFLNMLDQTLGTKLMPAAPQTPGGAQPVRGAKPLPPKMQTPSPVKPKGKVLVEQPDGTFK